MTSRIITTPAPTVAAPSQDELLDMMHRAVFDDGDPSFETTDGRETEADGTCQHDHPTWLRANALI